MKYLLLIVTLIGLAGCQTTMPEKDPRMAVAGHINEPLPQAAAVEEEIPPVVTQAPIIAAPKPAEKLQTFTVVAADLPASELLFALARDARLNLDIDPAISGNVSINAIDQTLPQILKRISNQVSLRYYMDGPNMVVKRDLPFMRSYKVDYLNMTRDVTATMSVNSKVGGAGGSSDGGGSGENSSTVSNKSSNNFWASLETNLKAMAGSEGQVISNRESGVINVIAASRVHQSIQKFIDNVMTSARRQVLIEATVVEVTLNDEFQAGVDWSRLTSGNGWDIAQSTLGGALGGNQFLSATFTDKNGGTDISASIKALDAFGNVSVMSSPKIMALNNQTSVLKVVDNRVYFSIKSEVVNPALTGGGTSSTTTTIHTVPVGFVMSVTPYVTGNNEVILNVRPTISRILKFVNDPTPNLTVANPVPEISVREMESVLRVSNGNTAVIGGLMQDTGSKSSAGIPGLHETKGFGVLFGTQDRKSDKTELVIFLRPRIIDNASLDTNLQDFKRFLKPKLLTE